MPRQSFTLLAAFTASTLLAQVSVLTNRYDNHGTGANLHETELNSNVVTQSGFGKLYSYEVDGAVYAQPLYVPGVQVPGAGKRNIVYIATMHDKVYAFDADAAGAPLWSRDLTNSASGTTPVPITDITRRNDLNIVGNVGILSTPVIDGGSHTIYVLARTKQNGAYFQRLYALDIRSGK